MEKKIFEESKMEVIELAGDVITTSETPTSVELTDNEPWRDPWEN